MQQQMFRGSAERLEAWAAECAIGDRDQVDNDFKVLPIRGPIGSPDMRHAFKPERARQPPGALEAG